LGSTVPHTPGGAHSWRLLLHSSAGSLRISLAQGRGTSLPHSIQTMFNAALNLSAEALVKEVCDRLTAKGLLKANEFICNDREATLVELFGKSNLDDGTLASIGGRRRLEVRLLSVTASKACAWLGNVVSEPVEMVDDGAFQARSEHGKVRSGHGEVQPRALTNQVVLPAAARPRAQRRAAALAALTSGVAPPQRTHQRDAHGDAAHPKSAMEGTRRLELLGSEDLAFWVCDRLVEKGLLNAQSTYERRDRALGISSLLRSAHVDGEALAGFRDQRSLEQHLLGITGSNACMHSESAISDLADILLELPSAEQADRSSSDPFETAPDGLDSKDLGISNSTASPPQSRDNPRLEDVAARVCTRLVEKGLLKTKPAFVRTDREASICTLLRKAGLEGAALTAYSDGRSLPLSLQSALNGEACAWLDNTVVELIELLQGNDSPRELLNEDSRTSARKQALTTERFDEVDPAQKLPVTVKHTGAEVVDSPRSIASCSTCDCVREVPAQKHVSFSAAPDEVLHIVPYSEMYILHPRNFQFDSDGRYITGDEAINANLRSAVRSA